MCPKEIAAAWVSINCLRQEQARTDLHRQVRVHLATMQVDVNLLDELDDFLMGPAQEFGEHPHTQPFEPARNILIQTVSK